MPGSTFIAISAAVTVFLLVSAIGLWAFARRDRRQRLRAVSGGRSNRLVQLGRQRGVGLAAWRDAAIGMMESCVERFNVVRDRQAHHMRVVLGAAGFRTRDALTVYAFMKAVLPFAGMVTAGLFFYFLAGSGQGALLIALGVIGGGLIGSYLPDIVLARIKARRLARIERALPDALDLLVISAEAGLSMNAAIKRVADEMRESAPHLSDELSVMIVELRFLPERRRALDNLEERVPLPGIHRFVNTLIQAERYGTPLARALRVLSQEQRTERMMRAEEKTARLPALMTVPLILFILPALFIVLMGPAILDIVDSVLFD